MIWRAPFFGGLKGHQEETSSPFISFSFCFGGEPTNLCQPQEKKCRAHLPRLPALGGGHLKIGTPKFEGRSELLLILLPLKALGWPSFEKQMGAMDHFSDGRVSSRSAQSCLSDVCLIVIWVWVTMKPPGIGPQVLVHVSIYQGHPFGVPIFDPQPSVYHPAHLPESIARVAQNSKLARALSFLALQVFAGFWGGSEKVSGRLRSCPGFSNLPTTLSLVKATHRGIRLKVIFQKPYSCLIEGKGRICLNKSSRTQFAA